MTLDPIQVGHTSKSHLYHRPAGLSGGITIKGAARGWCLDDHHSICSFIFHNCDFSFAFACISIRGFAARTAQHLESQNQRPEYVASMPGTPGHEPVDHPSLSAYVSQMEAKNLSYMNLLAYIHFLTLNIDMRTAILSEVREDVSKIKTLQRRSKFLINSAAYTQRGQHPAVRRHSQAGAISLLKKASLATFKRQRSLQA